MKSGNCLDVIDIMGNYSTSCYFCLATIPNFRCCFDGSALNGPGCLQHRAVMYESFSTQLLKKCHNLTTSLENHKSILVFGDPLVMPHGGNLRGRLQNPVYYVLFVMNIQGTHLLDAIVK